MNAEQILQGIIPVDRELTRLVTKIIQQDPLPTDVSTALKKSNTRHGVFIYRYTQDSREHDKTLENLMASGNDLLGAIALCKVDTEEPLIDWDRRRELEGILISRGKWSQAFEERRKNGTVIYAGDGKTRVN